MHDCTRTGHGHQFAAHRGALFCVRCGLVMGGSRRADAEAVFCFLGAEQRKEVVRKAGVPLLAAERIGLWSLWWPELYEALRLAGYNPRGLIRAATAGLA